MFWGHKPTQQVIKAKHLCTVHTCSACLWNRTEWCHFIIFRFLNSPQYGPTSASKKQQNFTLPSPGATLQGKPLAVPHGASAPCRRLRKMLPIAGQDTHVFASLGQLHCVHQPSSSHPSEAAFVPTSSPRVQNFPQTSLHFTTCWWLLWTSIPLFHFLHPPFTIPLTRCFSQRQSFMLSTHFLQGE